MAVILILIPFTTYQKTTFTELSGRSFTNGFSGPKSFRDFRETGPWNGNIPSNIAGLGKTNKVAAQE